MSDKQQCNTSLSKFSTPKKLNLGTRMKSSEVEKYIKLLYDKYNILKKLESGLKRTKTKEKDRHKCINSLHHMYMEEINGTSIEIAEEQTKSFILNHSKLSENDIDKIFTRPKKSPRQCDINISVSFEKKGYRVQVQHDQITIFDIKLHINEIFTFDQVMFLLIRYSILAPDSGFFWSIPPPIYYHLEDDCSEHNYLLIEGFASPLNYNIIPYCSLYEEDKAFGAIGDFFTNINNYNYLETNNREEEAITWICNPPFTYNIINNMYQAALKRLNECPCDRFIFMLPAWPDLEICQDLEGKGTLRTLEINNYYIYNFIDGSYIQPRVDMNIGYLRNNIDEDDIILFNELIDIMINIGKPKQKK